MKRFKVKYNKAVAIEVQANSYQTLLSTIITTLNLAPTAKVIKPPLKSEADFEKLKGGEELAVIGAQLKQMEKINQQKALAELQQKLEKEKKEERIQDKEVGKEQNEKESGNGGKGEIEKQNGNKTGKQYDQDSGEESPLSEESDSLDLDAEDQPEDPLLNEIDDKTDNNLNLDDDDDNCVILPSEKAEYLQQDYNLDELYIGEPPIQGQDKIIDDINLDSILQQRLKNPTPVTLPPPRHPLPKKRKPQILLSYIDPTHHPVPKHSALYSIVHLLVNTPKLFRYVRGRLGEMMRPSFEETPDPEPIQQFHVEFCQFYQKLLDTKRMYEVPFFVFAELWLQFRDWFREKPVYAPYDLMADITDLVGKGYLKSQIEPEALSLFNIEVDSEYSFQQATPSTRIPNSPIRPKTLWTLPILLSQQTQPLHSLPLLLSPKFIRFPLDKDDQYLQQLKAGNTGKIRSSLLQIRKLPQYLLIHIDRYGPSGQKNRQLLRLSKFLDLNHLCSGEMREFAEEARKRREAMMRKFKGKKSQEGMTEMEVCYSTFDRVARGWEYDGVYHNTESEPSSFTNSYKLIGFTTSNGFEKYSETYASVIEVRRNLWYYRKGTDDIITMTEQQALNKYNGSEPGNELADLFLYKRIYLDEKSVLGDSKPTSSFFQESYY